MTTLENMPFKPLKKTRSMEIASNSFTDSSKNAERSRLDDDSNQESEIRADLTSKRANDRIRAKNNTLPN